jgi:RNA polymerase sigma factor (sigma-70 family)
LPGSSECGQCSSKKNQILGPTLVPHANHNFEQLIGRLAEGSEEAGWELLDRYSTNILRAVRRHLPAKLRRTVDSTDIVQSVWKSLLRKGPSLDSLGTPEQLVAYLAGMARLKVLESQRAHSRRQPRDPGVESGATSAAAVRNGHCSAVDVAQCKDLRRKTPSSIVEFRETWNLALEHLGARGERVIELRLQGRTLDEIAAELHLGKRTVQRILSAMLESLEE